MKIYILLFLTVQLLFCGTGNYYDHYENLNNEPLSALSSDTGVFLFDIINMDIDEIDEKNLFSIGAAVYIKQTGDEYGNNALVSNAENIDILKSFSLIYNYQRELMPFISYGTPYKSVLNYGEEREIIKKRDAVSFGFVSDLRKHQVGMSIDMLLSTYRETDGISDYTIRTGGFSARVHINMKVNKRSSMFFSMLSPAFLKFDIDNEEADSCYEYFNNLEINGGLKYKTGELYAVYSLLYRSFDKFVDQDDGRRLTYPWIIEHSFISGYDISKTYRVSVNYKLVPVSFTENMPVIGDTFRHSIGGFIGCRFKNIELNMGYTDSKILSERSLGRTFIVVDMRYKIK